MVIVSTSLPAPQYDASQHPFAHYAVRSKMHVLRAEASPKKNRPYASNRCQNKQTVCTQPVPKNPRDMRSNAAVLKSIGEKRGRTRRLLFGWGQIYNLARFIDDVRGVANVCSSGRWCLRGLREGMCRRAPSAGGVSRCWQRCPFAGGFCERERWGCHTRRHGRLWRLIHLRARKRELALSQLLFLRSLRRRSFRFVHYRGDTACGTQTNQVNF